jgi:hypothetical protein
LTIVEAFRVRRDGHFAGVFSAIGRAGEEYSSAPGSHLTVIGDTIFVADFNFATEANVLLCQSGNVSDSQEAICAASAC